MAEIKRLLGAADDGVHVADVRVHVADGPTGRRSPQGPGVAEHHRVVVHVDGPALRHDGLRDLLRITGRTEADADVDELPDAGFGDEVFNRALVEGTHGGRDRPDDRRRPRRRLHGLAVGLEVVGTAPEYVPEARGVRHTGIDLPGLRPARLVLVPVVSHPNTSPVLPRTLFSRGTAPR